MGYVAKLGGDLLVLRDGASLGSPPNTSCAALLLALLAQMPEWSDRAELAESLYPGQSVEARSAAFRVALSRLKGWLGEPAFETTTGRVRLRHDWTCDLSLSSGEPAQGNRIAPGVRHPLADQIRTQWRPQASPPQVDLISAFIDSVRTASETNSELGRSLLVAGMNIADSMHPDLLSPLLAITRPKTSDDHHFAEYCEIQGVLFVREGAILAGIRSFVRGFRQALRARNKHVATRIGYRIAFTMIEKGDFDAAELWISRLEATRRPHQFTVESTNAHAALAWNANRMDDAMEMLGKASVSMASTDHYERMHFLSNYAVLAADLGELNLADELIDQGRQEASTKLDRLFWLSRDLVIGKKLIQEGRPDLAAQHFGDLKSRIDQYVDEVGTVYALEWQAEALARTSNPTQADVVFRKVCSKRKDLGFLVNPRTRAKIAQARV